MTSQGERKRTHEYELGHSDRELRRLATQAQLIDPFTREFFCDGGLAQGMRVLDVGSGAGDTALLAANIVAGAGEVVGIDRSPLAVSAAQDRVRALGRRNISFREATVDTLDPAETFDAAVGRYVLMFSPDPASMLKSAARHVRPGGVIVFHEADWRGYRSTPPSPAYDKCCDWIVQTFRKVGTNPFVGSDLYSAFMQAGIPSPTMALRALIGGASSSVSGADLVADLAVTMVPVMEEHGVTAPGEIDPAVFKERLIAEVMRLGSVVVGRSEIGAWSRLA
jgi:ubiquinone/menaquinone biosynthesis C-methylase UbiE